MSDISKINVNGTEYDIVDTEAQQLIAELDKQIDLYSYGVLWDTTVADSKCTRIGNPSFHRTLPVLSLYKGCVVKDGVLQYYLDPDDWSKKKDGSSSVLDGTDGDVCVHTPKFYYRSFINGNIRLVRFSMIKIDDTWIEMPEAYVGAYRTALDRKNSIARTVVNTSADYRGGTNNSSYDQYLATDPFRTLLGKPATNISRAIMRTYARNNGTELLCYEYYKVIFYWAYVIEYANFNCQDTYKPELTAEGYHLGGLGAGITLWTEGNWSKYNGYNPLTPCGYTNSIGNKTGVKPLTIPSFTYTENNEEKNVDTITMDVPRWRGFENPFGDIWTNLDGIVLKRDVASGASTVYTTTNPTYFNDNIADKKIAGVEAPKEGFIKELDLGSTVEIIPSVCTGAYSTIYKCDYHYTNTDANLRTLLVGGGAADGGRAGLLSFISGCGVAYSWLHLGFRTILKLIKN